MYCRGSRFKTTSDEVAVAGDLFFGQGLIKIEIERYPFNAKLKSQKHLGVQARTLNPLFQQIIR